MTIASEITRLQWAKADIKTAIENKWVTVPASAKLDTYDTYIGQIETWVPQQQYDAALLMEPNSYRVTDCLHNSNYTPRVYRLFPDIINSNNTSYIRYFLLENSASNCDHYWLCAAKKNLRWDFTYSASWEIDPGNCYNNSAVRESFRVKRSWNDIVASLLYYVEYQSYNWHYYTCQTHTYYCINMTNENFSNIVNLWQYSCSPTEQEIATIYSDWEASCWISAVESIYWIDWWLWMTSLWVDRGSTSNYYDLVISLIF